jgi:Fe-S-cluster containining protein
MAFQIHPDDSKLDPTVSCARCEAVCCRLTVVLDARDEVAESLVVRHANGTAVIAHAEDGWCVALDRVNKCCSIYANRPLVCRKFAMGGGYCRLEREKFGASKIPLRVA